MEQASRFSRTFHTSERPLTCHRRSTPLVDDVRRPGDTHSEGRGPGRAGRDGFESDPSIRRRRRARTRLLPHVTAAAGTAHTAGRPGVPYSVTFFDHVFYGSVLFVNEK